MTKDSIQLERERLVNEWIPDLFSSGFCSVLYVGANRKRQHFVDVFEENRFSNITILEIFPENVSFLREKFPDTDTYRVVHGDVREVEKLNLERFDVVFFWHGIDLLPKDDIVPTLRKLEGLCKSLIVLGMPYGRFPRDDTVFDSNQNEDHVSPIYPAFLRELGYETRTHGPQDQIGSSITAWKTP